MLILTIFILSTLDFPGGATEEKAGIITVQIKNKTLTEIEHVYFRKTNYFHSVYVHGRHSKRTFWVSSTARGIFFPIILLRTPQS
jgi:3-polyprenyl-4-hydroxybenzoate decarboxylase